MSNQFNEKIIKELFTSLNHCKKYYLKLRYYKTINYDEYFTITNDEQEFIHKLDRHKEVTFLCNLFNFFNDDKKKFKVVK